ncbi:MAG: hypothetical protein JRE64_06785 [Deltaproteobacteria bacterium]|nr:hypothetical protein [Deltaproteobacteria bacterium]
MNNDLNLYDIIRDRFDSLYPFSLISNVILYRNDRKEYDLFANEIDHLFHYKKDGKDHLVIVEVKQRELYGYTPYQPPTAKSPWKLKYDEKVKDIKRQVKDQATALKQFCHNVSQTKPEIECWIVDLRDNAQHIISDERDSNLNLLTLPGFGHKLEQVDSVIRVEHSEFLRELRRGIFVPHLGHPEIINAVSFIKTCRKSLDDQIYSFFRPQDNYYALNGCAGMGKSVLLAYSIFVFASDYAIYFNNDNKPILEPFKDKSKLPIFQDRKIYVYAVKKKQIEALKFYWQGITKQISRITNHRPALQQPVFKRWDSEIPEDCTILVIDESHDLSIEDQQKIANWIERDDSKLCPKYLLVACDRNQALKRKDKNEDIIAGINFSRHTTRLNRIYRCPFPVYVASIGLLFRWFAPQGGCILLSTQKLRECFGFKPSVKEFDDGMLLTMRNDCHPGNNWKQTVNYFTNCSTIYAHLAQFSLDRHDVLWACFEKTEQEFNYPEIATKYTFVDLRDVRDSDTENEIDLYIKGQEFSIVVVEGLPPDMNPSELIKKDDWGKVSEAEQKMWRCRKNVYIVCSRASAFLYFITDLDKTTNKNANELRNLIEQVSKSFRNKNESGQTWEFKVNKPTIIRKPDIFRDDDGWVIDETPRIVEIDGILSVPELASAFGILQQEFQDLLPSEAKAKKNIEITVRPDHANIVAKKMGIELKRVNGGDDIPEKQKEANHVNIKSYANADTKRSVSSKTLPINKDTNKQISKRKIIVSKDVKFRSTTLPFTGDCTKRKINKIILLGTTYYPATWQELLMKVSEKLYERHKDSFQKCLALQGTIMKYFSTNSKELDKPKQIGISKYYAETYLNAKSIVRRCRELMSLFGYGEKDLDIFVL